MNKKIHYAWYVMAAAFMMNLCVIGVASVGISIFLPALREKLNLTGTQSSFIMSLQGIATIAALGEPVICIKNIVYAVSICFLYLYVSSVLC